MSDNLKRIIVTVDSVTYAIKLKKLLKRVGIEAALTKVDNTENGLGCAHGVVISQSDYYTAVVIMKENGIEYKLWEGRG